MRIFTTIANIITRRPYASPDEVFYADVARHFVEHGRFGLQLWGTTVPGLPDHVYFYPPLFYAIVAGWSVIFGPSFAAQRLLTLTAAATFALILGMFTAACVRRASHCSKRAAILCGLSAVVLTCFQAAFIIYEIMSRPEIFVLLFGTLAMFMVVRSYDHPPRTPSHTRWLLFGGITASGAALIHPVGVLFPTAILIAILLHHGERTRRDVLTFVLAVLVPIVIWILSIAPHLDILSAQLALGIARKAYDPSLLRAVSSYHLVAQIPIIGACIVALAAIARIPERRSIAFLLPTIALMLSVAVVAGTSTLYIAFIPPYSTVVIVLWIADAVSASQNADRRLTAHVSGALAATLAFAILMTNMFAVRAYIFLARNDHRSYSEYARVIAASIPETSTVFVSAIPDPSFGFMERNPQQPIRQFPGLAIPRDKYIELLNGSDYVVYSETLEAPVFGSLLIDYIAANALHTTTVNADMDDWVTDVIELVPRDERVTTL